MFIVCLYHVYTMFSDRNWTWAEMKDRFPADFIKDHCQRFKTTKKNVCIRAKEDNDLILVQFVTLTNEQKLPGKVDWEFDASKSSCCYSQAVYNLCDVVSSSSTRKKTKKQRDESKYESLCRNFTFPPKVPKMPKHLPQLPHRLLQTPLDWSSFSFPDTQRKSMCLYHVYIMFIACL